MLRMLAFCRPLLAALALLTAAIAASVTPASARPHYGVSRHAHAYRTVHQARWHQVRYHSQYHYRQAAGQSRWEDSAGQMQAHGFADSYVGMMPEAGSTVRPVRYQSRRHYRHVAQQSRWERGVAQMRTRGLADSHASVTPGTAGAVSAGVDTSSPSGSGLVADARRYLGGNPIMISGNNGNRVREAPVSRGRIYAYVMPN